MPRRVQWRLSGARASFIIMSGLRTRSHSQLGQYAECGEAYRLNRVMRVPSRPGWWFPGGTATHSTIELYLREQYRKENGLDGNPTPGTSKPTV
jgi:hypothetical protein